MVATIEVFSPYKDKRVEDVIQKLKPYIPRPLELFHELDPQIITKKIDNLSKLPFGDIVQDKVNLVQRLEGGVKYADDHYHLLAHLFLSIRQTIPQDKFDEKRERKNLDCVLSLLCGNTKELSTGRGKSSVVSPTYLFFQALWSKEATQQIFSPPNNNLLNEATKNYEVLKNNFTNNLPENLRYIVEKQTAWTKLKLPKKEEDEKDFIDVFTGDQSSLTDIFDKNIPVVFSSHNDTVFSLAELQGELVSPKILFDEIHQLTGEHFISTTRHDKKKVSLTPENLSGGVGSDIADFIISKFLYQNLSANKGNFFFQGNELHLSEQGTEVVEKAFSELQEKNFTQKQIVNIIDQFVLPGLQFKPGKKEEVVKNIFNQIKTFWKNMPTILPDSPEINVNFGIDDQYSYLLKTAEDIVSVMGGVKPGEDLIISKGRPSVREAGRGILLPSHQYNNDTDFLIRVVNDGLTYQYKYPFNRLRYSFSFPTFLTQIAQGKIQGLTANLFDTDLETGKKTKSQLASILESFTEGRAEPSEEKGEKLPLPTPHIFENMDSLLGSLDSKNQNQELVICYNDYLAKNILEKFNDPTIGLIISTTEESEIRKILKKFADGEIKKVITSGRAGYGVDIKKTNGSFPDFHITIINPETPTDISQGFGRLRKDKKQENFDILLTEDSLNELSTLFYEKKPLPLPQYHTLKEFQKALDEFKKGQDQSKFVHLFHELLRLNEKKSSGDYLLQTELEIAFQEKIVPIIKEVKKGLIEKIVNTPDSYLFNLINQFVSGEENQKFIKQMIVNDLEDFLSFPEENLFNDFMFESNQMKLHPQYGQNESVLINKLIDNWRERFVGKEDSYRQFYQELFQNNTYLREEIPHDFLLFRAKLYKELAPLISKTLPLESVDLNKVINVSFTPLLSMEKDTNIKETITITDSQDFIKIDDHKYLIIIPNKTTQEQTLYIWEGEKLPEKNKLITVNGIRTADFKQKLSDKGTNRKKSHLYLAAPSLKLTNKPISHLAVIQLKP